MFYLVRRLSYRHVIIDLLRALANYHKREAMELESSTEFYSDKTVTSLLDVRAKISYLISDVLSSAVRNLGHEVNGFGAGGNLIDVLNRFPLFREYRTHLIKAKEDLAKALKSGKGMYSEDVESAIVRYYEALIQLNDAIINYAEALGMRKIVPLLSLINGMLRVEVEAIKQEYMYRRKNDFIS